MRVILFLSLVLVSFLAAAPVPPSESPRFRGDAAGTGRAVSSLPAAPKPLWTFQAEKGFFAAAAIAGNTVYAGSLDGHLYALDLTTGKLRWKLKTEGEVKSTPAIDQGAVYFGDEKGVFRAVEAATGKVLWTFKTEAGITSSANFAPGCVLFGSYDQNLYCLAPKTGKLVWKVETEGYVHASPAVVGEHVIISGCDATLRVVRARDGKPVGQVPLGGYVAASPAVLGGRAYVGSFENEVLAVDLKAPAAPKVAWRFQDPARQFPFYASAAATEKRVIVAGRDKRVRALSPQTGKELWSYTAGAAIDSSPLVLTDAAKERVAGADKGGTVFLLNAATGKELWRFEAGSPIEASPAVAGGRLVIGTDDGVIYCFG